MPTSAWSTQQLAEFLAAVSSAVTEASAARAAVERAAEALDAEVAAIVRKGDVVAAVGYPEGTAPAAELDSVVPGAVDCELSVPGVGSCSAAAVALEHPPDANFVLARSGTDGLSREEAGLLRGMARVTSMTMWLLRLLDDERAAREQSDRQAAENARLLEALTERQAQLERLAEEQAALRRVATLVAGQAGADDIFAAVAEEVGRLLRADVGGVCRYEPDGSMTVVAGWSEEGTHIPVGTRIGLEGDSVTAEVLRTGRPARLDTYEGLTGPVAEMLIELGTRSSVGAPIFVGGRIWGAMIASSNRLEPLPSDSEQRLAGFTELVATAISNAQARTEVAKLADEQAALRRVATLVARAVPLDELFATVTEELGRLVAVDGTAIVRNENGEEPAFVAAWSAAGSSHRLAERRRIGEPLWRSVLETGRPARLELPSPELFEGSTAGSEEAGFGSLVGCPIIVEGRVWGAIGADSTRPDRFSEDIEAHITGFTELVATAISNAASRAQLAESRARIVAMVDETRRRIERDLHDGVQQRLVTLALELRGVTDVVPADWKEAAQLHHLEDGLKEVLGELHEISRGVHPAILSEGGVGPALKALARRSTVPVELNVNVEARLPKRTEVAAYYLVSEALTNTAKHAGASVASVDVELKGALLRLSVRDDGCGGADPARGSGLIGITDRVEALGGSVEITSPLGVGTTLLITLPLGDR